MKTRPWPIVILAAMQFLSPIVSVLLSAQKLHTPPGQFFILLLKYGTWLQLFDVFGSCIIAGIAIFAVKNWSYPVFLAISGWGVYSNIHVWSQFPQVYSLATLIMVNVVNLSLVSYFLIPAVSAAYFNPRLRWWESKPRFKVDFQATIKSESQNAQGSQFWECLISDISEGGVFLKPERTLALNDVITLSFSVHQLKFSLKGRVLHQGRGESAGYGVQFIELSGEDRRAIKAAIRAISLLGYDRRDPAIDWWQDFRSWCQHLFRTGEGLIPKVPKVPKPRPSLKLVPSPEPAASPEKSDTDTKAA